MRPKFTAKLVAAILALVLLVTTAGCTAPAAENPTVTVTDQLGRAVEVPREVKRIVTTYYISTSIVLALGAGDRLVGVEMKADTRPLYQQVAPEVAQLPGVGTAKTMNIETVVQLEPDLVIVPVRMKEYIEKLEEQGIAVIAFGPEDLDSLADAFLLMGEAIGAKEKGQELAEYYQQKVSQVKEVAAKTEEPLRVYLAGKDLLRTCTREMYQHTIISLAGGDNVSGEIETGYWANVSLEQVLKWDPEVILLVEYGDSVPEELGRDPKWQGVAAVKNNQVYRFPSVIEPWDTPGPAAVLGILWLSHILQPDSYSQTELEQDAQYFYQHFYNANIPIEDFAL